MKEQPQTLGIAHGRIFLLLSECDVRGGQTTNVCAKKNGILIPGITIIALNLLIIVSMHTFLMEDTTEWLTFFSSPSHDFAKMWVQR